MKRVLLQISGRWHWQQGNGHETVVKLLLEKGAALDQQALTSAVGNGHEAVVRLLLEKGATLDQQALAWAAEEWA